MAVVSLSACAEKGNLPSVPQSDALGKFDDRIVGAAIVNACNPSFDWKRGLQLDAMIGRNAYNDLLHQLRTQNPNDPKNEKKADDALQSRIAENVGRGTRLVAEKSCNDPELQAHMRRFEAENQ
ncbi:MAG: hypothetical protein E6H74_00285 [Betaproteobacteria bacterium]|nr:MAG: hypothetical protein E6H74_00285 [Betaproteobacteria bacterium]